MSLWQNLLKQILEREQRPQPEQPAAPQPPPRKVMHIAILQQDRASQDPIQGALISGWIGRPTWSVQGTPIAWYVLEFVAPEGLNYGDPVSILIKVTGYADLELEEPFQETLAVHAKPLGPAKREGIVRRCGSFGIADDTGRFAPLGETLFWVLGGWRRGERDRVKRNWKFLRQYGIDFQRVLCHATGGVWKDKGAEIDWHWPDFQDQLASMIDAAYDEHGLRTQLTAIGTTGTPDPVGLAHAIAEVVSARPNKILLLEAVNEGNASRADAVAMARVLATTGLLYAVGLGDQGRDEVIEPASNECAAPVGILHPERGGDVNRQERQCWDFHVMRRIRSNGEPPGTQSSVGTLDDPFDHGTMRAACRITGTAIYVHHSGHGVFGVPYPYGSGLRYANLDEAPGLPAQLAAVRGVDAYLPADVEEWSPFNNGQPVDTPGNNVDKLYGSRAGGRFAEVAIGAVGPLGLRAKEGPCQLRVLNAQTGQTVAERHFGQGEQLTVDGLRHYIMLGSIG
jgi:hypothetical protein